MVVVSGLSHRYGSHLALDDVSLSVERGSMFALLGPNGSGKTTLFKILTTALTPSEGTATIAGVDVVTQQAEVRRRIGIVFQHPSLDDKLTVRENLKHQGHLYGLSGRTLAQRIDDLLPRFGLKELENARAATLSGGMRRRVELAKSMLHRPEVLILDEPGTGLDPSALKDLMDYLVELRDSEGTTVLLTTHLMEAADRCGHIALLDRGRLVARDTPESLKAMIGGDVILIHTPHPQDLAQRAAVRLGVPAEVVDGAVRIEHADGHKLVPALIDAFSDEITSVRLGKPTLQDVFLRLTGHVWSDAGQDHDSRSQK